VKTGTLWYLETGGRAVGRRNRPGPDNLDQTNQQPSGKFIQVEAVALGGGQLDDAVFSPEGCIHLDEAPHFGRSAANFQRLGSP